MNFNNFFKSGHIKLKVFIVALLVLQKIACAQSSEELSSQECFDEIIAYYDPDGIWDKYSGELKQTSIRNGDITTQVIAINNSNDFYTCIRNRDDGVFIKGVENGKSFFTINGKEYNADEIPEKYQKYPYSLSEYYAQTYKEHHTFHFSVPLALKKAGAKPLVGVGKKYLFGRLCKSITFKEYPNRYEQGYYGGQITLYFIPEEENKIHAIHFDNGWGASKEGLIVLMDGEIEVGGIKIPASKITFFNGSMNFLIIDALEKISDGDKSDGK